MRERPTAALMAETAEQFFERERRRHEREYRRAHAERFLPPPAKGKKPSYEQRVRAKLAKKPGGAR